MFTIYYKIESMLCNVHHMEPFEGGIRNLAKCIRKFLGGTGFVGS